MKQADLSDNTVADQDNISPPAIINSTDRKVENLLLLIVGLLYIVIYCVFWPVATTTMDEGAYLNTGYAIRHGSVYLDTVGISAPMSYPVGNHSVTQYPPGMPILLALTSILGWKLALGTNLLFHLCTYFGIICVLRRLKLPAVGAVLYLLHPSIVIYSRTVMSDITSGLAMTIALLCYLRKQWLLLGVVAGISVMLRTANGLIVPLFGLGLIVDVFLHRRRETLQYLFSEIVLPLVWIFTGMVPFIIGAYWYQSVIQQGGWARYAAGGSWGPKNLPEKLPFYILALSTLYPGMIIAPFLYRGPARGAIWMLCAGVTLFYACYYFTDTGSSQIETFIVGQRYLLTVLPIYIIAYLSVVEGMIKRFSPTKSQSVTRIAAGISAFILLIPAVAIHKKHEDYLKRLAKIRSTVVALVPLDSRLFCNIHVGKLMHPAWGGAREYHLLSTQVNPLDATRNNIKGIGAALDETHKPVYIAVWSRVDRQDLTFDTVLLPALRQKFEIEILMPLSQEKTGDKLQIVRIANRK